MKKKRKVVKKTPSKSKWYKSNTTWIIVGAVLFAVAFFALGFVHNQPVSVTGYATDVKVIVIGDGVCSHGESPISVDCGGTGTNAKRPTLGSNNPSSLMSQWFTDWSEGNLDINIAKYLLFFLLFMLIFSVLGLLLNKVIAVFTSIIVAFLATAYITPLEVYTILTTYTALGLVLSIVVPFFIMSMFSIVLANPFKFRDGKLVVRQGKTKMYQYFFLSLLWLLFVGFLIYKAIVGWALLSKGMLIVMGIVILFALFFIIKPNIFTKLGSHFAIMAQEAQVMAAAKKARSEATH